MTPAPPNDTWRARHKAQRALALLGLALGAAAWSACATAESHQFSDGDCVGSGCANSGNAGTSSSGSGSSSGGPCVVDPACKVKWATDIFAGILDTDSAGCTKTGLCHGDGKGNLTLTAKQPHQAYEALIGLTLSTNPGPAKKYIVPCDQGGSGMLCNMKQAAENPFGACGSLMPTVGTKLTMDQLTTIADWIACGAPEN